MDSQSKKTIQINPEFLKFPMKGNKTRKAKEAKPIKIRAPKANESDKTIKRRALNLIRKMQEDKYRRLMNEEKGETHRVEMVDPKKTYADEFKSDFDDSLAFLQKLTDQNAQKIKTNAATLKQYPVEPSSVLFNGNVLDKVLNENISLVEPVDFAVPLTTGEKYSRGMQSNSGEQSLQEFALSQVRSIPEECNLTPENFVRRSLPNAILSTGTFNPPKIAIPPRPAYGCLKGGQFPTYREYTKKNMGESGIGAVKSNFVAQSQEGGSKVKLTPTQQRAELKQFLQKKSEEKTRIEQVKRQRKILNPKKHQKRKTTRTFRVGKSKHYPKVGVLIPNKTIRTQVLAKKQKIRETSLEEVRKYLIKKGLIRVGSSCPNDVLRQMYESSMLICGELQNHNPDNLLFNYLNNAI